MRIIFLPLILIFFFIQEGFSQKEGELMNNRNRSAYSLLKETHYQKVQMQHRLCIEISNNALSIYPPNKDVSLYYAYFHSYKGLSFKQLANIFSSKTNLLLSLQYSQLFNQPELRVSALLNLSSLFLDIGKFHESVILLNRLSIEPHNNGMIINPGILLNNLAEGYSKMDSSKLAEESFQMLLSNQINFLSDPQYYPSISYRNYGFEMLKQRRVNEAFELLSKALKISLNRNGPTSFQTAKCYYHLAQCHDQMGHFYEAQQNFDYAIEIMEESLQDKSKEEYSYETSYIEMLTGRGEFLLKQGRFEEALADLERAINRVNLFVNTYQAETTRFFIADVGIKAFKLGILCQMKMNPGNLDQAFEWSLQAKSMSSYYTTKRDFRYPEAGMPVDSLYKLQIMREEIQTWMDGIDILSIRKEDIDPDELYRMVQLVVDYELLEQYVQGEYLKVRDKLEETKESDYLIAENFNKEVYLGYQDLDSLLLVFGVNKNGRFHKIIPCDSILRSGFIRIKDNISKPHYGVNMRSDIDEFASLAQEVYRSLLLPVQDELLGNKLVIHPDGILLGLPFECLIDPAETFESSSYKDLPFLINTYEFRYVASPFLRSNDSDRQSGGTNLLISCAGEDNSEIGLEETKGLYRFFDAESIMSLPELAEDFKSVLEASDHIHILSHQISNQDDFMSSGLVCDLNDQNRYLTFKDILFTRLNHPSVYINSCESGNGPMGNGEGLMSLSLAFTLAGAKSLVQHMWEADDESAGQIAIQYYKSKKRLPESEALQQAKLKYLKKAQAGKDHPHYWAGVVYYGSRSKPTHPVWIIFLGGFIILIIGWGVWKYYRR